MAISRPGRVNRGKVFRSRMFQIHILGIVPEYVSWPTSGVCSSFGSQVCIQDSEEDGENFGWRSRRAVRPQALVGRS